MAEQQTTDILIIGSGAAGLSAALQLAERYSVTVLSKKELRDSATYWAQGGIAAVQQKPDSFDSHIDDTIRAGAGLCNHDIVRMVINRAPDAVDRLATLGVDFTRAANSLDLTREGGHSHRRILHVLDETGKAISDALVTQATQHPNIAIRTNCMALDLICPLTNGLDSICAGAYVYDIPRKTVDSIAAHACILATGGASKAYLYSTNNESASGDGIAMAWRAGCAVANMEFNQFHPTCLYHAHSASFLLSEALRGEGGKLILPDGNRFMRKFDKAAELAPRDIVARAIDFEMKRLGIDCVYLDLRDMPAHKIKTRFPAIHKHCLALGIDICQQPIPVVPASHYTCGGVLTDEHGCTTLERLYCIGENACSGLHGANRLASNSLLECLVFADQCAQHIKKHIQPGAVSPPPQWDASMVTSAREDVLITHNWDELRRCMWNYVGIVRNNERLHRAQQRIAFLTAEIDEYYKRHPVHAHLLELRNLLLVSSLIVNCARKRRESRGLHYTLDYPHTLAQAKDTVLKPPL